jgi:hypothetical protein
MTSYKDQMNHRLQGRYGQTRSRTPSTSKSDSQSGSNDDEESVEPNYKCSCGNTIYLDTSHATVEVNWCDSCGSVTRFKKIRESKD